MLLDWLDPQGHLVCSGRAIWSEEDLVPVSGKDDQIKTTVYGCPLLRFTPYLAPLILLRAYPVNAVFPTFTFRIDGSPQKGGSMVIFGPSPFALTGEPTFKGNLVFLFPDMVSFGKRGINYVDLQMMISSLVAKHAPACLERKG